MFNHFSSFTSSPSPSSGGIDGKLPYDGVYGKSTNFISSFLPSDGDTNQSW